MKPLTKVGAEHFVKSFASTPSTVGIGVEEFLATNCIGPTTFIEGTARFEEFRDCLLREADRSLSLSINCFARSLEGLRAASAYWTLVSLYYSSFYSAKAVLAMHGCWMTHPEMWVEVVDANPGKQKLAYKTKRYARAGSHRVAWIAFYAAMNHLRSWFITPHAKLASSPVNSIDTWLIDTRNEYNYEPDKAFQMKQEFDASFDATNLPKCFGGKFRTMFEISHSFVLFARDMAIDLNLDTDVWAPKPTRKKWHQDFVTAPQDAAITALSSSYHPQLEY